MDLPTAQPPGALEQRHMLVTESGAKKSCGSYQNIQNREKQQHGHLSDTAMPFSSEVTIICLQFVQVIGQPEEGEGTSLDP